MVLVPEAHTTSFRNCSGSKLVELDHGCGNGNLPEEDVKVVWTQVNMEAT